MYNNYVIWCRRYIFPSNKTHAKVGVGVLSYNKQGGLMKYLGIILMFLGVLIFFGGIFTGEVCVGKSKIDCFQYAENPRKYLQFILVYPAFSIGMGWQILTDYKNIDLKVVLYTVGAMLTGYMISLFF